MCDPGEVVARNFKRERENIPGIILWCLLRSPSLYPTCRYDRRDRPPRRGGPGGGYGGGGRDYYDGDRGGYGGPRRRSPDYDRRRDDGPAERPRLILQPRSKPIEEKKPDQTKSEI